MAKQEGQYIKIKADANKEEHGAILKRVSAGELKWAYYCLEGDIGYQYYAILAKKKVIN